ncbi:MAG TPA: 50S ribosomal protein L17 [Candidatus Paceibacterota bacterium]|nr:50S ribosomal protein L17 [Candidatus Paceibacterota bacterium]
MRHGNNKRKFGRVRKVRNALINSLALNLIVRGKIKTTEAKAKELRPFVEKLVTKAKSGTSASRRLLIGKLSNRRPEIKKLFEVIAPNYVGRSGGYTRVLKLGTRKSDGAKMAIIEFV